MTKLKLLAAFFLLQFYCSDAFGQAHPIKFYTDTLENGLQVVFHIDKSAPVVTVLTHYKVGSMDENIDIAGISHLMEHLMMNSATENIPKGDAAKIISDAGGIRNAYTSFNETVYYTKLPSHQIKTALWMESERMRKLQFTDEDIAAGKKVIGEEIKFTTDNKPYEDHFVKMTEMIFDAWPILGYKETVEGITRRDLEKFYYTYYQPNNAILVISGNYKLYPTKEAIKDYFGRYTKYEGILRETYILPKLKKDYRKEIIDPRIKLPACFLMYRAPVNGVKDYYALSVLNNILSKGINSRLKKKLIDEEKIAVDVDIDQYSLIRYGGVVIKAFASPGEDIEDVEDVISEVLENIADDGVTERELQKAKNRIESDYVYRRMDILKKAGLIAKYISVFGSADMINLELKDYMNVKAEDIKRVAKEVYGAERRATLVYLPKKD